MARSGHCHERVGKSGASRPEYGSGCRTRDFCDGGRGCGFAVNPIVGAAVFAASKVLGPLWSKVSILRYHISGPLDDPQINEVLRQPRKEKRNDLTRARNCPNLI